MPREKRVKIIVRDVSKAPKVVSFQIERNGRYPGMNPPPLRVLLLQDALHDLLRVRTRYADLKELDGVWASIDAAEKRAKRRLGKKNAAG